MKVATIFGTRPEIIRLSLILKILDQHCDHLTIHTGQNFQANLSDIFLQDLGVRTPDIQLGVRSTSFGDQAGQIISAVDQVLADQKPDKVLILGDTNSALSAIPAARRGIPVFHMEAGNRCYDDRVPEEINRRIIDHSSTFLLPYTERSKENLVREGIERERIYVTGNPIKEVLDNFAEDIDNSQVLDTLKLRAFDYFLVTLHRAENVDIEPRLKVILEGLAAVSRQYEKKVVVSVHPRTANKFKEFGIDNNSKDIVFLDAMGFFDFVKLQKNSLAVLTDSGTVQEECSIFGIPNVTIRDVTERPETIECGSNILSGADPDAILKAVELAISQPATWVPPKEYTVTNVSQIVSRIVLGFSNQRRYSS